MIEFLKEAFEIYKFICAMLVSAMIIGGLYFAVKQTITDGVETEEEMLKRERKL